MSNSALSLRQLVAVLQWSGADNVSFWTRSHSQTSPLRPQEGSLRLTDPLCVGDWNKVLDCSVYDKLIRRPNCFNCVTLHLLIVGFQGCNYIFVQKEALVRRGTWSEQMIYGTLAPQFCVIVLHDGNIALPPSCLLSSLSTMGHKPRLNFELGFLSSLVLVFRGTCSAKEFFLLHMWHPLLSNPARKQFLCRCLNGPVKWDEIILAF